MATSQVTRSGGIITAGSASGGVGKTVWVINLAWHLSRNPGRKVVVIDLKMPWGDVATMLGLQPRFSIVDAVRDAGLDRARTGESVKASKQAKQILKNDLTSYVTPHASGFSVLASPADPADADMVGPEVARLVIEAARHHFDFVVIDTPAQLTENTLAALEVSDVIHLMSALDLPSVRNLAVLLTTLEQLDLAGDQYLLMGKADKGVGIGVDDIAGVLKRSFDAVLPYDKEVIRSIQSGQPVLASAPKSEISKAMSACLPKLL